MHHFGKWLSVTAVVIATIVTIVSCAPSSVGEEAEALTYSGQAGKVILQLDKLTLYVNEREFVLSSCATSQYFCLQNKDIDFYLVLPKQCPKMDPYWNWTENGMKTVVAGNFPETDRFVLLTVGHPHFLFVYDTTEGLIGLYYDPQGKLFGEDEKWHEIPQTEFDSLLYESASRRGLMACTR